MYGKIGEKMTNHEPTIWGIHGGKTGDADTLFFKHNCVAIGWANMGDLSKLKPNRDAFKKKVVEAYPEKKVGAIPNNAGQLYRFVHEVKIADIVVYRSKRDMLIHLGHIDGEYKYNTVNEGGYPHRRSVKWLKSVSITKFSQGALYEIGSAMSLFQVKNYADEFRAALEGNDVQVQTGKDETVAIVVEEIEQNTRDFIIKKLAQELKGHAFADFIAHLLGAIGYRTRVATEGPDGGVDIIAYKDELGFEPPIIKVQVKSREGNIGDPEVSALYGKVSAGEYGLVITLGAFTNQAMNFAKNKTNLRLIDGDELVDLIIQTYDKFDARYKGLLPLRHIYVAEQLEEEE